MNDIISEAVRAADRDAKGWLTKQEYRVAMTAVFGHGPDKLEMRHVLRTCPDKISYGTFRRWVSKKWPASHARISGETLFALLDRNCNGQLTWEDFHAAGRSVGLRTSADVWRKVFRELDRGKKGSIGLAEFLAATEDPGNQDAFFW